MIFGGEGNIERLTDRRYKPEIFGVGVAIVIKIHEQSACPGKGGAYALGLGKGAG